MSERQIDAGTQMLFGVPANPMPEIMADAIGQVVAQVPGIREAYLPQCYIEGDAEAHQVLVIGVDSRDSIPAIMQELMGKMRLVLPERQFIDIIPFTTLSMPSGARVAECKIFEAKSKPWWKLW
jgi:hypothetical protein